jgi:2-iminobutanoate/2-iminopropanoate deaminase
MTKPDAENTIDSPPLPRCLYTANAPKPIGYYCQGVVAGGFIFISGQGGFLPDGSPVSGGAANEARQAIKNIAAILGAAGVGLRQVVRITIYYSDIRDGAEVNKVYEEMFKFSDGYKPARMVLQVANPPVSGTRVWLDAQAVLREPNQ